MSMPKLRIAATGNEYQTMLPFTMTGTWRIDLHLHFAAHAPWQQTLMVQVHDGKLMGWHLAAAGGTA